VEVNQKSRGNPNLLLRAIPTARLIEKASQLLAICGGCEQVQFFSPLS
jgi:hypothetical protein